MHALLPGPTLATRGRMWLFVAMALLSACDENAHTHVLDGNAFGTRYQVQLVAADPDTRALGAEIEAELADIDRALSTWREDSEISAFNQRRDEAWVTLSPAFATVMAGAASAWRETKGAFDPTLLPLSLAWGFQGAAPPGVPTSETVDALRDRVGMDLLELSADGRSLRKRDADVMIDLSAIAKGFAADRVGALLDAAGIRHWLVEIGGEVRVRGRRADGGAWRIAVTPPDPGMDPGELPVLELRDEAIATSGDYRNAFLQDDRRYSHVFDPATGRPAGRGVTSATVIASTAMRADALATAFLVMAPDDALATADRLDVALLLVLREPGGFERRMNRSMAARAAGVGRIPE